MKSIPGSTLRVGDQSGFTLIELMISIVIGLIILAAAIGLFVSMTKSDSDNLKSIRLNQELRATMSLIARDLRRAGANRNAAADSSPPAPTNPFSTAGTTRLAILSNSSGKPNACVTYSYDVSTVAGTSENFGYSWDSNNLTVDAYSSTNVANPDCTTGTWTAITDGDLVEITDDGQTGSPGYVAGTPRGLQFADATVTESGVNIHEITITLWGRLKKDHSVMRSISETIRVRNDA
ncbi:MAG: PilW family protein [Methylomonas sp.]